MRTLAPVGKCFRLGYTLKLERLRRTGDNKGKANERRDKNGVAYKGHRKSAADGFSMEIPPKKPIITKPKNEDEKKD